MHLMNGIGLDKPPLGSRVPLALSEETYRKGFRLVLQPRMQLFRRSSPPHSNVESACIRIYAPVAQKTQRLSAREDRA
jgi:hypothetical protein